MNKARGCTPWTPVPLSASPRLRALTPHAPFVREEAGGMEGVSLHVKKGRGSRAPIAVGSRH